MTDDFDFFIFFAAVLFCMCVCLQTTEAIWPVSFEKPPHHSKWTLLNYAKTQNNKSHSNKTKLHFICL